MAIADLVLEGGGAKVPGLVGAITALANNPDPYSFHRVAGASAGAIVAAMVAAGVPVETMKKELLELDFTQFEDVPAIFSIAPVIGQAFGLIFRKGMYEGDALHSWLSEMLAERGIRSWADLRHDDPNSALPPERRYKLVVIVSDVSRGRMLRLPWDYRDLLGVDPDRQSVADAIRASASIPFFFQPFRMATDPAVVGHRSILCVDGGILSNFPVDIFDRRDEASARWPTLGVKLSARENPRTEWQANANTFQFAKSLARTMLNAHDRRHLDDPDVVARTVFVDTDGYSSTDFELSAADKLALFDSGLRAGRKFLSTWDWERWKETR